jgi:chemotaxis signal transduction protein
MSGPILLATVEGRSCAIAVSSIRSIVRAAAVVPRADFPPGLDGVCIVAGQPLPVISVRARLGVSDRPVRASDFFVITHADTILRVDEVVEIRPRMEEELPLIDAHTAEIASSVERAAASHGVFPTSDGVESTSVNAPFLEGPTGPKANPV